MATADKLEWPKGTPLFELAFRAVSEGMNGVGVLAAGDMEVSATANANEISVSTGDLWVPDTTHTIGSAETHSLSDNTSGSDRWDTVVFDTGTGASAVKEGTAAADPEPPDLASGEILLAYIYVPDGATDTPDSNIYNWRAFSTDAADVRLDDSAGEYSSANVEDAFTEVIREAGDPLNGPLDLSSFSGSAPFDLGTNPGAFGPVVDATVDSNSSSGTAHSFTFALDSTTFATVYAEADGSGGLQNLRVDFPEDVRVGGDILTTGGTTLFDASAGANGQFPRTVLDDERVVSSTQTANYTTSGEEVIPVDPSGGAITITVASADISEGNFITVVDVTGNAGTNTITIDTEGSETIDDASSVTIEDDYGAKVVFSPHGSNLNTAGGGTGGGVIIEDDQTTVLDPADALSAGAGLSASDDGDDTATVDYEHTETFEGRESGNVSDTNQGVLVIDHLADGETVEVYKAVLLNADGTAVATGVDLELVTLDNSGGFTSQTTLISGDGSTVFDDETGSPLGSYSNSSGGGQTIAVLVDNGSGSAVDIMAAVEGVTGV